MQVPRKGKDALRNLELFFNKLEHDKLILHWKQWQRSCSGI